MEEWVGIDGKENHFMRYRKFLGGTLPPIWGTILSKKLGLTHINHGKGGACNDYIFESFCKTAHEIKKGDIVIIEWTINSRFRLAVEDSLMNIRAVDRDGLETWGVEVCDGILYNREKYPQSWAQEIYHRENLIETLAQSVGFEVFFWSADDNIIYSESHTFRNKRKYLISNSNRNLLDYLLVYGAKTIHMETFGEIIDGHYGGTGHAVMAEHFYKDITKKMNL